MNTNDLTVTCNLCDWTATMRRGATNMIEASAFLRAQLIEHVNAAHPIDPRRA